MVGCRSEADDDIAVGTVLELLPMLALIARKDLVTNSDSNRAYVTGEMNALISNDTWYESIVTNKFLCVERLQADG
jgi:hypothetical protein